MSKQLLDTPSKHSSSLTSLADRAWNRFSETVINAGWSPLSRLSEAAVVAVMRNMSTGQLRVLTYSNIYTFPSHSTEKEENKELKAELRVVNDAVLECDDLVTLFRIFLDNREKLSNMDSSVSFLFQLPQKLTSYRFLNTISNSRSNISAHYDISNDMFQGFLSKDMTYSCAIFEDLDGDLGNETDLAECNGSQGLKRLNHKVNGTKGVNGVNGINGKLHPANGHLYGEEHDPLYDAQMRKLRHILKKAKIQPGHRVLEIGSGWGSMAILIAQSVPDTTIDTLTLSVHQQTLARERIAAAGLQDRITVHLMDYRDMPSSWEGAFDRFISIEMIEAVGAEFIVTYWRQVDWALKKKGGVGVIQVITIPEAREYATPSVTPLSIPISRRFALTGSED
ncbi:hypothetical protein D9758_014453 [Tetrapyrgos nigripes]|uniref:Cyclopropane-fatty-acyl-phospholipid synthase n=1 Tax=Tetrapyrgos nigripes TaxID=182062 RepID=A0A8H5BWG3_9AGAR|nr:hypothetical protein D9758_014453 [Tetrapyrgos nigripes]